MSAALPPSTLLAPSAVLDPSTAIDWLGTFAAHSTLALGAALLLSMLLRQRALALQEHVLRASLWLALVSATAQCALQGVWSPELVWTTEPAAAAPAPFGTATELAGAATAAAMPPSPWWAAIAWSEWLLLASGAAALGGLTWLAAAHRRLRAVLRARRPETDARVLTTAAEVARSLGLQQSPHVSRSGAIATPIAFGLVRPEICLPMRVGELSAPSLRAMLAHEVAHLRAADPAWMWGAAWLQALFPWQVLFVLVRRRWARLVELRCDGIAAEHATPTAVARCLLDVAEWLRPGPEGSVAALGMAARPSALRERVEAALQGAAWRPARPGWSRALSGLALTALTAGAPAVATGATSDAGDTSQPAALAPTPPPAGGRAAWRTQLDALAAEQNRLEAEAARLRAEPALAAPTPELAALQRTLDQRLQQLTTMRARLAAALERTESADH